MATNFFLKAILAIMSFPFVCASILFELLNIKGTKKDIERCLFLIDTFGSVTMSRPMIKTLITAEDRRNTLHCGIDSIAILRAIHSKLFKNSPQGASTIEQQFVRVALGRYERTLSRKLREQLLAISVCRRTTKERIATSYLSMAFYGTNLVGIDGISRICSSALEDISYIDAIRIVSRLKYPEPLRISDKWREKYDRRCAHLRQKLYGRPQKVEFSGLCGGSLPPTGNNSHCPPATHQE